MSVDWYDLGLQLKVKTRNLDSIKAEFGVPKHQLREMLKAWLTSSENPTWKNLIDALRSESVGAKNLATILEAKYYLVERTELDRGKSIASLHVKLAILKKPLRDLSYACDPFFINCS